MNTNNVLSLDIELTRNCNFQCKYCFESKNFCKQDFKDPDKLIEILQTKILPSPLFSKIRIGLWGGEPTLNKELLLKLLNTFKDELKISFQLYSNGSNLSNFIDLIKHYQLTNRMRVQISYDGNPIHDEFRVYRQINNTPTSPIVIKNLQLLKDNDITFGFKSTIPISQLSKTYDAYCDLKSLYETYKSSKSANITFYNATLEYRNLTDFEITESQLELFKNNLLKITKSEIELYKSEHRFGMNWFNLTDPIMFKLCSAGAGMFSIDVNGDVYLCHGCLYLNEEVKRETRLFNIFDDVDIPYLLSQITSKFKQFVFKQPTECTTCITKFSERNVCFRCNVRAFCDSKLENFKDKWMDLSNSKYLCTLYKVISQFRSSLFYIIYGDLK